MMVYLLCRLWIPILLLSTCLAKPQRASRDQPRDVHSRSRVRRQVPTFDFAVIRNSSFPCSSHVTARDTGLSLSHKVEMTNEEKKKMLEQLGGQYWEEYMAPDLETAIKTFPHIFEHTIKEAVKKVAEASQLEKESDKKKQALLASWRTGSSRNSRRYKRHIKLWETETEMEVSNDVSPEVPSDEGTGNTIHPQSGEKGSKTDGSIGKTGASTSTEQCLSRGRSTGDGFLYMCTVCPTTTELEEDYWPRVFNELLCSNTDYHCLIENGIPHGICHQRAIPLNIMRKKDGHCVMALRDGQSVLVDDYQLVTKYFNVGCECDINKNSKFAEFV